MLTSKLSVTERLVSDMTASEAEEIAAKVLGAKIDIVVALLETYHEGWKKGYREATQAAIEVIYED